MKRRTLRRFLVLFLWILLMALVLRSLDKVRDGGLVKTLSSEVAGKSKRRDEGGSLTMCLHSREIFPSQYWSREVRPSFLRRGLLAKL